MFWQQCIKLCHQAQIIFIYLFILLLHFSDIFVNPQKKIPQIEKKMFAHLKWLLI